MLRKFIFIFLSIVTAIVVCVSLFIQNQSKRAAVLPELAQVQNFELTNQDGAVFSQDDVKGKVWVASFVFTSCAGPCPLLTARVSQVAQDQAERDDVRFVSISVDPETDTPAVLKEYGKRFQADFKRWQFLTGARASIAALMTDQFKLGYAEDIMFHSDRLALVDRYGKIRGYYSGSEKDDFTRLKKDLAKLVKEK